MPCRVEPYADSPEAREELIPFLAREFASDPGALLWHQRLAHWWDENPFAGDSPCRGWILRHDGALVGFLGIIPTRYAHAGGMVPALIVTSWAVAKEHRNAALAMGVQIQKLRPDFLLLQTTPSAQVREVITRLGWTGETKIRRVAVPVGRAGRLWSAFGQKTWPSVAAGRRITTDVNAVRSLARPWQESSRLEKWTTPESLRWYAGAPSRLHQFIGVVDAEGRLTSFLWFTPRRRLGLPFWLLLEAFSTEPDAQELTALVGSLVRSEAAPPGPKGALLLLTAFPQDARWSQVPRLFQDEAAVCHFHSSPPSLQAVPKHTVMAEGDFGL